MSTPTDHRDAPTGRHGRSLLDVFAAQLADKDRVALIHDGDALTYGELDRLSAALATRLRHVGAGPGVRVGLGADRSVEAVVGMLGILRAGAAYVPLDPGHPADRLQFLVDDASVKTVVAGRGTDFSHLSTAVEVLPLESLLGSALGTVDAPARDESDVSPLDRPVRSDDEAYVIYTSGSTGAPKGCSVSHGNVVSLLDAALPLFDVGRDDRWTLFHSCSFDFSVWEIWGAFATGAALVVVDRDRAVDPKRFLELCCSECVTVICSVPSVFRGIALHLQRTRDALGVRYVVLGGETVRPEDVRAVMDRTRQGLTSPRFINVYGITETTVLVTFKELTREDVDSRQPWSPIGTELTHLRIAIVDETGRPVADGQSGEMLIAGDGVIAGYVGRDELTAQRFVTVDGVRMYRSGDLARRLPTGELGYEGRIDDQVKVRGFRVELAEVDAALRGHPLVRDASAVLIESDTGTARIEAGIVAEPGADLREVRAFVAAQVPAHLVPARVVALDHIPQLVSGKLDRRAVAETLSQHATASAPESASTGAQDGVSPAFGSVVELTVFTAPEQLERIEDLLVEEWRDVLGADDFGLDDGFFDVGGDSLSVVALHERISEKFPQAEIRIVDLFVHPTIRSLAQHLQDSSSDAQES